MRRFLLATAAVAALALAAPIAAAQKAENTATPVYATPGDPSAVAEKTAGMDVAPAAYADKAPPAATHYAQPVQSSAAQGPKQSTTAQSATHDQIAQMTDEQDAQAEPQQSYSQQAYDTTTAQTPAYQTQASADQSVGADQTMSPTMIEYAQEAGMAGVPMSAAEVCAPRDVSLAQGTSRLNHETRQQLRFAADRASACDLQQVVIQAPDGRGAAVRETLIAHGVDDSQIQVEQSSELGVEMTFAGVATSSEQYAAIFNSPQQMAATDPNAATVQPSSATATAPESYGYQQTGYSPSAPATATNASYSQPQASSYDYNAPDSTSEPSQTPVNDDTVGMNETETDPVEDPLY